MNLLEYVRFTVFESELSYLFYGFLVIAYGGYFLVTGLSFLYFYKLRRTAWLPAKIQPEMPEAAGIMREIFWSLSSTTVWVFFTMGVIIGIDQGVFKLYFEISEYGYIYFFVSIALLIVIHDAYFYWTHRFMHATFGIYKLLHRTHHRSVNPTPFAIHTFNPLEAILYALYIPLILLVMPVHLYALLAWFATETAVNLLGHLGYEMASPALFKSTLGRHIGSGTHHNLHHQQERFGFGHYFNFWDRTMGTNHASYTKLIERD